jgi:hypothetical protein
VPAATSSSLGHSADPLYSSPARNVASSPAPVLVELDHLLNRELGADAFPRLLGTIKAGELDVEDLTESDRERVAEPMRTYADLEVRSRLR